MLTGTRIGGVHDGVEDKGEFLLLDRLGEGTYGTVYIGVREHTSEKFAIKIIPTGHFGKDTEKNIQREAAVMQGLSHRHVVKLRKFIKTLKAYYLVMDLEEGGELFDLIIESKVFDEKTARRYFQQLLSAISYCHSQKVAHRDLKAENLLLDKEGNLKVCDFGFSMKSLSVPSDEGDETEASGTLHYMSPEQLSGKRVDLFDQDVWAAGVILFFMLSGKLPFDGRDDEETAYLIESCQFNCDAVPPSAAEYLKGIFVSDTLERMSLPQMVRHPWFTADLDWTLFPPPPRRSSRSFLDFTTLAGDVADPTDDVSVTPAENSVIKHAFECIDVDGYGTITQDELRDALIALKQSEVAKSEVEKLMQLFNADGNNVTFEQFRDAWVKKDLAHTFQNFADFQLVNIVQIPHVNVDKNLVRELRRVFDGIDALHTGAISKDLMKAAFLRAEVSISDEEVVDFLRSLGSTEKSSIVTFDDFVAGITKKDVLACHPLGPKLASATNLTSLAQSRTLSECMGSGLTVCGQREAIADKLVFCDCLSLLSTRQDGHSSIYSLTLKTQEQVSKAASPPSSTRRLSNSTNSENADAPISPQKSQILPRFEIIMSPTALESYVSVQMRRIAGPTKDYHEAVAIVTKVLDRERQQAVLDSATHGESELL